MSRYYLGHGPIVPDDWGFGPTEPRDYGDGPEPGADETRGDHDAEREADLNDYAHEDRT